MPKRKRDGENSGFFCNTCFHDNTIAGRREQLRAEGEAICVSKKIDATPSAEDPAIGVLVLPLANGERLPPHASEPEFLTEKHCRLCLKDCSRERIHPRIPSLTYPPVPDCPPDKKGDASRDLSQDALTPSTFSACASKHNSGVDPSILEHLRSEHNNMTASQYRRRVFGHILAEGPQPVSPQVLRTRLTVFKKELQDINFREGICGCCARSKCQAKLTTAVFVPPDAPSAPSWLGWSSNAWLAHAPSWFEQLDSILNVEHYLRTHFHADERLRDAEAELMTVEADANAQPTDEVLKRKVAKLSVWCSRVKAWAENLRRDLRADSVLAPGTGNKYWLLCFCFSNQDRYASGVRLM